MPEAHNHKATVTVGHQMTKKIFDEKRDLSVALTSFVREIGQQVRGEERASLIRRIGKGCKWGIGRGRGNRSQSSPGLHTFRRI